MNDGMGIELEEIRNLVNTAEWEASTLRSDLDGLETLLRRQIESMTAQLRVLDARVLNIAESVVRLHPELKLQAGPLFPENAEAGEKQGKE